MPRGETNKKGRTTRAKAQEVPVRLQWGQGGSAPAPGGECSGRASRAQEVGTPDRASGAQEVGTPDRASGAQEVGTPTARLCPAYPP